MSTEVIQTAHQIAKDLARAWDMSSPSIEVITTGERSEARRLDDGTEQVTLVGERYEGGQDKYAHEVTHVILNEMNAIYLQLESAVKCIAKEILSSLEIGQFPYQNYLDLAEVHIIRQSSAEMVASFVGYQLASPLKSENRIELIDQIEEERRRLSLAVSSLTFALDYRKFTKPDRIIAMKENFFNILKKELEKVVASSHRIGQLLGQLISSEKNLSGKHLLNFNPHEMKWLLNSEVKIETFLENIRQLPQHRASQ